MTGPPPVVVARSHNGVGDETFQVAYSPPSDLRDVAAEQAVVGSLLVNPNEQTFRRLKATDFSSKALASLFVAMVRRWRTGRDMDQTLVLNDARQIVGGDLVELVSGQERSNRALVGTLAAAAKWDASEEAGIVADYAARRAVYAAGQRACSLALSISVPLATVTSSLEKMTNSVRAGAAGGGDLVSLADAHSKLLEKLEREVNTPVEARQPPIVTGLGQIDKALDGGLIDYDKFHLSAEPGTYKSSMVQGVGEINALLGRGTLIGATEMKSEQLAARHISAQTGIVARKLMSGWIYKEDMPAIRGATPSSPLVLMTAAKEIDELVSDFWRAKYQLENHGSALRVFVVDYLQKLYANRRSSSRREEVNYILMRLAELSDQTGVPQIVVSSIGRDLPPGAEPNMRQAMESSMIESEASVFMLMWRNPNGRINWKFDKVRDGSPGPRGELGVNGGQLVG